MLEKTGVFLRKCVNLLFQLLMCGIVVATIMIDNNIKLKYPNVVKWDNAWYFLIAAIILTVFAAILCKCKEKDISQRKWLIYTLGISGVIAVIQFIVACWMPVEFAADFKPVRETAIHLANGGMLTDIEYFKVSPNNINIMLIFSWVYSLLGSWKAVVLAGAFLTNIAVTIAAVAVVNLTGNRICGLFTHLFGGILVALTWRAFIPYTDNWGMIFASLIVLLYSSKLKTRIKLPLVIVVGALGSFVKETLWILLLAIGIHAFIMVLKDHEVKKLVINSVVSFVILLCCVIGINGFKSFTRDYYQYEKSPSSKNWTFLFMVGQNTNYFGVVNTPDRKLREEIIEQTPVEELNKAFIQVALGRVKDRGILGNVEFYLTKLNVAYNDGYFNNLKSYKDKEVEENFLYDFYINRESDMYAFSANMMQVLWDMILLLFMLNAFIFNRKGRFDIDMLMQIIIIGITLYIMLFEGRSKYLYMFAPVYVFYAGIILRRFVAFVTQIKQTKVLECSNFAE